MAIAILQFLVGAEVDFRRSDTEMGCVRGFQVNTGEATRVDPRTVLSIILGGGAGTRLYPLTKRRAKPAVSFSLIQESVLAVHYSKPLRLIICLLLSESKRMKSCVNYTIKRAT